MPDDRQLMLRLRSGDREALRAVYEKHKEAMRVSAMCLVGDRATAEDCVHDVFVAFAASAPRMDDPSTLRGYLVACVSNRAIDILRKRGREGPASEPSETPEPVASNAEPAAIAAGREEAGRIYAALLRVPYEQREVVVLHIHGDMTFREIARQQCLSINTVQSRYRYGIERMRLLLNMGEQR